MTGNIAYAAALAAAALSGSVIAFSNSAQAQTAGRSGVTLSSEAKVERVITAADGSERVEMRSPKDVIVTPGDRIVFTLSYENKGAEPATGFRATNPMPGAIQFISAAEDWAMVSVDGGKTFGKLASMQLTERIETDAVYDEETGAKISDAVSRDETRPARAQDVTHVRWIFSDAIAPGAKGSVSYRGVVK